MKARIHKPGKNPMQSGGAHQEHWLLEYQPEAPQTPDPLMGWNSMKDTTRQIQLWFASEEEAVEYARKHHIPFEVIRPKTRIVKPKSYADNFKFNKVSGA